MNLTTLVRATGQRVRAGKMRPHQLTNAQVREVLESAFASLHEALLTEGRLEIQGLFVLERKITHAKRSLLNGSLRKSERIRWVIRVKERE